MNYTKLLYYLWYLIITPILRKIISFNIVYSIGRFKVNLPFDHRLPLFRYVFPKYSENIGHIAYFIFKKFHFLRIINVGANIGDSIFIIKNKVTNFSALCIEPDKKYFELLKKNVSNYTDIKVAMVAIGSRNSVIPASIIKSGGTAKIVPGLESLPLIKLDSLLQKEKSFMFSNYLVIDTDGFDLDVIRGSKDLIRSNAPVVFFELDPKAIGLEYKRKLQTVLNMFIKYGYCDILIFDNFGELVCTIDVKQGKKILFQLLDYQMMSNKGYYYDICALPKQMRTMHKQLFKTYGVN